MTKIVPNLSSVQLLILDVDGVMTDGGIYYREEGSALLRFSINDGLGIVLAMRAGVEVAVLTTGSSQVLAKRIERLGIKHFRNNVYKKGEEVVKLMAELGVEPSRVAYVSDDINDVTALRQVGFPIAVENAQDEVKAIACWITQKAGGFGAVREVCNRLIRDRGLDPVELWENGGASQRS